MMQLRTDAASLSIRSRWWAGSIIAALIVVLLLMPLPNDYRAAWTSKLLDLGHVALFAAAVWLCRRFRVAGPLTIALVLFVLAAGCEAAQTVSGRDVNVWDFVRSVLGITLGVVWMPRERRSQKPQLRWSWRLVATVLIVAWPVADAVPVLSDALGQYRSFPVIAAFDRPYADVSWRTEGASIERIHLQDEWVGRLRTADASRRSFGAVLFPVVRDWRDYERLCWEFEFEGEPLTILISVRDGRRVSRPKKRFDSVQTYEPGRHTRCFDLETLARGGEFAPLDLSRIQSLHFVVSDGGGTRAVDLVRVSLE